MQAASRPDFLWPEMWLKMSKSAQRQEKQEWAIEKPKLGNARRLIGICFIDPDDVQFKETVKNARKKLELPMEAAMPFVKSGKLSVTKLAPGLNLRSQSMHAS